ncbi:hypothetical protein BYT27DRAFT_7263233 [Phlegmacium glaucopus]|nr:hypothetical protein BYT27DRAFT_7263233 [Phlegmacium glaucopus]
MPLTPLESNIRVTRAGTTKSRADPTKNTDMEVTDAHTAKLFLINGDFKHEDTEMSMEVLSMTAMQLSRQTKTLKHATEALKALAFLITDIHLQNTTEIILEMVAKSVNVVTKRIRTEITDMVEQLSEVTGVMNTTIEELREECHNAIEGIKEAIEKAGEEVEAKKEK